MMFINSLLANNVLHLSVTLAALVLDWQAATVLFVVFL